MSKNEDFSGSPGDGGICLFGAEELLVRLRGFFSETAGVLASEDPENLHRMRVASRRIRSALPLLEGCVDPREYRTFRKDTRRFTRALGDARDADVQMIFLQELLTKKILPPSAASGIQRLLLRLSQKRRTLQQKVEEALQREAQDQKLHAMERELRRLVVHCRLRGEEQDSKPLRERARTMLELRLEEILALGYVMGAPEFFEGHHDLRIAVKRLRYTLELFRPLLPEEQGGVFIKSLKDLQTLLGDLHDLDVWREMLPPLTEEERERTHAYYGHLRCFPQLEKGMALLEKHVIAKRKSLFGEAAKLWKKLEETSFWRELYRIFEELPKECLSPSEEESAPLGEEQNHLEED